MRAQVVKVWPHWAVLSCGSVNQLHCTRWFWLLSLLFKLYAMVWPFKWKPLSSSFLRRCLFFTSFKTKFDIVFWMFYSVERSREQNGANTSARFLLSLFTTKGRWLTIDKLTYELNITYANKNCLTLNPVRKTNS